VTLATVQITGYTGGTLDLTGDNPYSLSTPGWTPNISRRKVSALGGPIYDEVEEVLPLVIVSSTKAGANTALADLIAAIDQAERWRRGENIAAVLLEVDPDASGDPVKAAILGASGGQRWMQLSPTWRVDLEAFAIGPFDVGLVRRGAWLGAEQQRSESAATANNPGIMTPSSNFSDSPALLSPFKMTIDFPTTPMWFDNVGKIAIAKSTAHIRLEEGEGFTAGDANFASAADADASGGNVGRYTPADTDVGNVFWDISVTPSFDANVRSVAILVNLKNRSSTISYKIRPILTVTNGAIESVGRWKTIDTAGFSDPTVVVLGPINSTQPIVEAGIGIQPDGTGAASESLDIDVVCVVALDNQAGGVLTFDDVSMGTGNGVNHLLYNHALLTDISPEATFEFTSGVSDFNISFPYTGNPYLYSSGNSLAVCVIGNRTGASATWRIRDSVGSVIPIGLIVDRRIAYMVPE
jgi:hypothetical protein